MKKALITALAIVIFLNVATALFAEDQLSKFSRGLCNVTTCFIELWYQTKKTKDAEGSMKGMTYGLAKGLFMVPVRALVGVYEVATFLIPYPENYEPILTDPVSFFPEKKK